MMTDERVLQGDKVRLRAREERDLPLFVRWYSDPDVRHWLHLSDRPDVTLESERERFEKARDDPALVVWVIETLDGRPIGNVGLQGIDRHHGRAELGISIGEKEYWGRGYGTDAIRQVLGYAFAELGLRRLWLITDEDNERGIRCYEKCGFVREGLLRNHRLRHSQPLNMIIMGALRQEWTEAGS